jgi:hypothetical protein
VDASSDSASFVNYLRSFGVRWFTAMSGPLSVPLAVAAILVTNGTAKSVLGITAMGCIVFASYWTWRVERESVFVLRERVTRLLNEYNHSLRLESVDAEDERQLDQQTGAIAHRRVRFVLRWRNTISRPIQSITRRTEVDGVALAIGNSQEVISASSTTTFFTAFFDRPIPQGDGPERYALLVEVHYGPVDMPPSRQVRKRMNLTVWPQMGRTDFIYEVNQDEPLPTS